LTFVDRPCILISAPGSGHGKTSIAAGLARSLARKGLKVAAFKLGPDFLDPMILTRAAGSEALQLDLWMMGEESCRSLLYEGAVASDFVLIEAALGLFDGSPSAADFAKIFGIPAAVVVNARGMAQTAHAIATGLINFDRNLKVTGYVVNGINSERHQHMVTDIAYDTNRFLGTVMNSSACAIPNRHLGLVQADEIGDLEMRIEALADAVERTRLASAASSVRFEKSLRLNPQVLPLSGVRIAIAKDEAFSFIYAENMRFLQELGAELIYFSPLTADVLPPCDSLYLPGGYPEQFLNKLSANDSLKLSIQNHNKENMPIYAECGGMLYLLEHLKDKSGKSYELCGLLPGHAEMTERMQALGYLHFQLNGTELRGHTFHYSRSQVGVQSLVVAERRIPSEQGEAVYQHGNILASYLHIFFAGKIDFATRVFKPIEWGEGRNLCARSTAGNLR